MPETQKNDEKKASNAQTKVGVVPKTQECRRTVVVTRGALVQHGMYRSSERTSNFLAVPNDR